MVNIFTKLRHFDAYPKPLEDFRIKTLSGAIITSITTILVIVLFIYEWKSYVTIDVDQELFVDLTRNQKLTINLDLTFPHLHCSLLSLDAMDVSGEHQNDVVKGLKKIRLDRQGKILTDDPNQQTSTLSTSSTTTSTSIHSNNSVEISQCQSCYGAEASNIKCCNTCDDVKKAYRQKNWHFSPYGIEQCKDTLDEASRNMKASIKSEDSEAIKRMIESGEGCQLQGHLEVNKVAGNFHIAPGFSFQQEHMHIHDIKNMPIDKFNTGHFFDVFSFGDEYPNQYNPLEKKNFKPKSNLDESAKSSNGVMSGDIFDFGIFQIFQDNPDQNSNGDSISYSYFLKVVPTTYEYLDGRIVNNTYQYSVTRSTKLVTGASLFSSQLPGVFVNYELSPIMVKYIERPKSFTHFITGCCAIIGGLFTIAGMFDSITFRYYNMYKKHQMNKLT
ncbi:unnamed protein product [Brachionus calyciflorus]|uniref:ERGIC3 n=1 Tax=Brachionus calyciflorus TaxID=104777 RepID=A0A813MBW8_9BILA|nr:unnamed protein product [Brachionus calyciflorus]